jgi:hypothetical protein
MTINPTLVETVKGLLRSWNSMNNAAVHRNQLRSLAEEEGMALEDYVFQVAQFNGKPKEEKQEEDIFDVEAFWQLDNKDRYLLRDHNLSPPQQWYPNRIYVYNGTPILRANRSQNQSPFQPPEENDFPISENGTKKLAALSTIHNKKAHVVLAHFDGSLVNCISLEEVLTNLTGLPAKNWGRGPCWFVNGNFNIAGNCY